MLLNKSGDLYQHHLSLSLDTLMQLMCDRGVYFHQDYKKQVLLFMLLGFVYMQTKKYKLALKMISQAQKITSKMDQQSPRNVDYILSVNVMTALILLKINKPKHALEFLKIADRMAELLVEATILNPIGIQSIKDIHQDSDNQDETDKKSKSSEKRVLSPIQEHSKEATSPN